jgi:GNAT superfamily N-acetyltransferase
MNAYSIRQFSKSEIELYKSIRLEALQLEPGVFSSTYEKEIRFDREQWLDRLNGITRAAFGLYHDKEIIGLTGIFVDKEHSFIASLTQSYIRVAHRGAGLSKLLYEARINWAKQHGIKKLQIGHREDNLRSKSANQRYGFKYTHRESLQWPDGCVADSLFYELDIE